MESTAAAAAVAVQEESPSLPSRTTILGSFLRGRPRNSSQSHITSDTTPRELSPSPQPPSPGIGQHRRNRPTIVTTLPSQSGLGLSHMLRRRRSAGNMVVSPTTTTTTNPSPPTIQPPSNILSPLTTSTSAPANPLSTTTVSPSATTPISLPVPAPSVPAPPPPPPPGTHRIRLVPHLDSRRTLRFDAIGRDLREGDPPLRIGRFTDRSGLGLAAVNALGSNKLAFKSKVVSRAHAEIWVEAGGKFFIKDSKSSSGTFLNHVRLSPANTESRPFQMKDGDILQLGVDYQGGAEDIYKSVKIRVEVGREWQAAPNAFNTNALKNLKTLALPIKSAAGLVPGLKPTNGKSQIPDCCICLFSVTIRQALFIAPCSHTFHYKCIRPLLETHHPAFSCPLCRTFADLEEDVEVEVPWEESDLECDGDAGTGAGTGVGAGEKECVDAGEREREAGMETETEGDNNNNLVPNFGAARARRSRHHADEEEVLMRLQEEDGDEDGDEDEVMVDVDGVRREGEEAGRSGSGSGSGEGEGEGADSGPELGMMVVAEGEGEVDDVDGTVGGKRKR